MKKSCLFDPAEYEAIVKASQPTYGKATDKQSWLVYKWCQEARAEAVVLEAILNGEMVVGMYIGNEPVWKNVKHEDQVENQ